MMSMVHNKVLKELAAQKRIYLSDELEDVPDVENEDPMRTYFKSVDVTLIDRCIEKLSPKQQMALKMYYFDDASLEDVGRALDVSAESARVTLWRIRKRLKSLYLKEEELRWNKDESKESGT